MGFPWKIVLTFGLSELSHQKPGIGAIVSALVHAAEKDLPGPGRGLEKAQRVLTDFIDGMQKDGIDVSGEPELLEKVATLRDLTVSVENDIKKLRELKK